jgi:hypothetical protein
MILVLVTASLATACGYDTKPVNRPTGYSAQPQLPNPLPPPPDPGIGNPPPPVIPPPITHPPRSRLSPLTCPWGVEQSREASSLMRAGVVLEYACDHVLFQEALYGAVTPNFPTFDDVKRSYDAWVVALGEDPTLAQTFARGRRIERIVFVTKQDSNDLALENGVLTLSLYGLNDPRAVIGTVRAVLAYSDSEFDGLPVMAKAFKARINGSPAQRAEILNAIGMFGPAYREGRDRLREARSAIRAVELEERHGDQVPLYRNGILSFPARSLSGIEWAYDDALTVAKTYSRLPQAFRNRVSITVNMPSSGQPGIERPEKDHAKAIERILSSLELLETLAPGLRELTLATCSRIPVIGDVDDCASANDERTQIKLGMFSVSALGETGVVSENTVANEIRRLFGLGGRRR